MRSSCCQSTCSMLQRVDCSVPLPSDCCCFCCRFCVNCSVSRRLLNGNESAVLTLKTVFEGIEFETPACIRLTENPDGTLRNNIECCKRYPELDTPYFNVEFTPEVKQNLQEKGNAGCVVELELAEGVREPCLVSLNPKTNQLHHVPVSYTHLNCLTTPGSSL